MPDLHPLAAGWFTLAEVADQLGCGVGQVRRMIRDRDLLAVRHTAAPGEPAVLGVPTDLFLDGAPLPELRGTLTVLADAGFTEDEALRWLLSPDDTLAGRPVESLRAGRRTEVRRRAQALAF